MTAPKPRPPAFTPEELEKAGQAIAEHVITAGEDLLAKLAGFDALLGKRLGQVLQTLSTYQAHLEQLQAGGVDPRPPPDPVKTSALYLQLLELGIDEDVAYTQAAKKLDPSGPVASPGPGSSLVKTPIQTGEKAVNTYFDTEDGRARRVWDLLHDKPPAAAAWSKIMAIWSRLEAAENKHSVQGEGSAFEQLYPAIVTAARAHAGKLPMLEFLDEKAIKDGRSPWELEDPGTDDAIMLAELNTMLHELGQANHPMAQAPPRTTEKEGGRTLTESTKQYHSRVRRVYQQLQMLQAKGV